ncbi:Na+/H+ antiporter subunit E [Halofilum ochraceum]|uniref:Na+/H+ antiporter subunit E n=1 Tax=Halofilum ochraceum TaxID=1611323 RepID=UPI0009F4165B|nr:Na+/H+ antiporter subunit E [Halofilum ochraceum]
MAGHEMDDRSFLQRWLPHPLLTLVVVVMWMALLNDFSSGGLVVGLVLGIVIPILTSHFWPDRPAIRHYGKAIAFVGLLLWDVIVANIQVAWLIVFRPASALRVRWVAVPIEMKTPEAITLLSATITMTPGTVTSDISADGRSLLVHCLDAPDVVAAVEQMKNRYERRIKEFLE